VKDYFNEYILSFIYESQIQKILIFKPKNLVMFE